MKLTYFQTKVLHIIIDVLMTPLSVWIGFQLGVQAWGLAAIGLAAKVILGILHNWNWYWSMEKMPKDEPDQ